MPASSVRVPPETFVRVTEAASEEPVTSESLKSIVWFFEVAAMLTAVLVDCRFFSVRASDVAVLMIVLTPEEF